MPAACVEDHADRLGCSTKALRRACLAVRGLPPKMMIQERAGVWTTWTVTRGTKSNPVEGEHMLFGFLTTDANAVVKPIHPKAMPVILTTEAEIERWMTAPAPEALELQRPLPDDILRVVAQGERKDGLAA
jgi:putative SOS response-associated peptidase YedK